MVKTDNEEIGNLAKPQQGWLTKHHLRCYIFSEGNNHSEKICLGSDAL